MSASRWLIDHAVPSGADVTFTGGGADTLILSRVLLRCRECVAHPTPVFEPLGSPAQLLRIPLEWSKLGYAE